MLLILSTPNDLDTEKVIEWLSFYGAPFFRLNDEDLMMGLTEFSYNPKRPENSYFKYEDTILKITNIKKVWFRKFGFLMSYEKELGRNNDFYRYIHSEFSSLRKLIFELLDNKKWLYRKGVLPSKPKVLEIAYKLGLEIPSSIITNSKNEIYNINSKTGCITKAIGDGKQVLAKGKNYPFMTIEIDNLKNVSDTFSPSFIQSKINKKYEIRSFYINERIYSMAIFSQNDKKTKLDFRLLDQEKPIRFVPYKLPNIIEKKILNLMKKISLNTGSLDFIKSNEDQYIFLEVNPSGQFGMTAYPCNYPLHEQTALTLINL